MSLLSGISGLVRPVTRRVRSLLSRGTVLLTAERGLEQMQVALHVGEVRNNVERFGQYGFTSRPHPGAEVVVGAIGGDRGHCVVLAVEDRRYRIKSLAAGEVAIYTDEGDSIVLKRGRVIEISTGTLRVSGAVEVIGNVTVTGDVTSSGNVADGVRSMAADRVIFNTHVHSGVESGSSSTAPPTQQQ
jgi:phage gp45-like